MTQINLSEYPITHLGPQGLNPNLYPQFTAFFGHWDFEFGYYLIFVIWCLEFFSKIAQLNNKIHMTFCCDCMK